MRRKSFALLRTFVLAALVPALSLSLVACDPENGEGGGTDTPDVTPEVSVPDAYENYFIEDLSFSRSAGKLQVAFLINVDWTMNVVGADGDSISWCSVVPASGDAGLNKVMVRVTDNDSYEPRSAKIHLMSGESKLAEIAVIQNAAVKFEAVDLGLSVKWANCNVGAKSPEEYGGYYAWGETEEKGNYAETSYKYFRDLDGDGDYYDDDENWINIGSCISGTSYDVARVKCGGGWRMPTLDEIKELFDKCSWQWATVNGKDGQKVTGPNGNFIFLPAAGFRDDTNFAGRGSYGYYWSGTLYEKYSHSAHSFYFYSDDYGEDYDWRSDFRTYGHPVRPVTD